MKDVSAFDDGGHTERPARSYTRWKEASIKSCCALFFADSLSPQVEARFSDQEPISLSVPGGLWLFADLRRALIFLQGTATRHSSFKLNAMSISGRY